ncbi:hypothetical protein K402DRAFT_414616 [Aulographum hederae CBS 113979]|uniref:Pentatricopeptide repeat protein n=1 Tax=Aulographum hederae CBS 113979 TaxID=1176131 RepID=A0A6G1GQI5_9PEZI|nr:hypothetical protein K402DRAFT_414616 [Aulographum hederae CBS 113979]
MSLFGSIHRSTSSPIASQIVFRPLLTFLYPSLRATRPSKNRRTRPRADEHPPASSSVVKDMDNIFIHALVRAGTCPRHTTHTGTSSKPTPFTSCYHKARRRHNGGAHISTRGFHTSGPGKSEAQAVAIQNLSKEEAMEMVDQYDMSYLSPGEQLPSNDPEPWPDSRPAADSGVHNTGGDQEQESEEEATKENVVKRIKELLEDDDASHDELFDVYKILPSPGVAHLSEETVHKFIRHFSIVEQKSEVAMIRFLSLIDDMKAHRMTISVVEWSSAIHFAGTCFKRITTEELDAAMSIWREMESVAQVRSSHVTFTIMFDIASKAGKFALADIIMKEMQTRGLKLDGIFQTALIFSHSLRQDGSAVRKAYKDYVDQGNIVDTVVLNCVISSLYRCHEPAAAEHIFTRMKEMHHARTASLDRSTSSSLDSSSNSSNSPSASPNSPSSSPIPTPPPKPQLFPRHWRDARSLGRVLNRAGRLFAHDAASRQKIQDLCPVAPNTDTYKLVIRHHALVRGDFDRAMALVAEMPEWDLAISGQVFFYLFSAFAVHGGLPYSGWTGARLEVVWAALRERLKGEGDVYHMSAAHAKRIVRAFAVCKGRRAVLEVWEEVREVWRPTRREMEGVRSPREGERARQWA